MILIKNKVESKIGEITQTCSYHKPGVGEMSKTSRIQLKSIHYQNRKLHVQKNVQGKQYYQRVWSNKRYSTWIYILRYAIISINKISLLIIKYNKYFYINKGVSPTE